MKRIIPSEDQDKAIKLLKEFINSNEREFTLSGRAGTGKTTVIREVFLKEDNNKNLIIPFNVLGVTISHMAKINLQKSIPNSTTYASAAGLNMIFDDNGNISFIKKNKHDSFNIKNIKFLIFDECYMVYQQIRNTIFFFFSSKCKVIWMGDHHQLPPIDNDNTKNPDADSIVFNIKNTFELKIPMRQDKEDVIFELCNKVCDKIDTDHDLSFINDIKNNYYNGKGIIRTNYESAIKSFVKQFNDVILNSLNLCCFLFSFRTNVS